MIIPERQTKSMKTLKLTRSLKEYESVVECTESFNELMHVNNHLDILMKPLDKLFRKRIPLYKEWFTQCVLSTDLKLHDEYLHAYVYDKSNTLSHRILLLKLADLSHFMRPFHVHLYWTFKLQNELQQNKSSKEIAQDQLAFGKQFVEPLLHEYTGRFSNHQSFDGWNVNRDQWQLILNENAGA